MEGEVFLRLDSGFWGPSALLPDEPPIEGERRPSEELSLRERNLAWRRVKEMAERYHRMKLEQLLE